MHTKTLDLNAKHIVRRRSSNGVERNINTYCRTKYLYRVDIYRVVLCRLFVTFCSATGATFVRFVWFGWFGHQLQCNDAVQCAVWFRCMWPLQSLTSSPCWLHYKRRGRRWNLSPILVLKLRAQVFPKRITLGAWVERRAEFHIVQTGNKTGKWVRALVFFLCVGMWKLQRLFSTIRTFCPCQLI